jgi:hypothetical protein
MRHEDHAIARFRQRLVGLYALKYGLAALTVWAFLYGTVVLALRGALDVSATWLLWGLASLPLALVVAAILTWRRLPRVTALRAVIDRHSRCGGLLMAGDEQPLDEWESTLPSLRQPAVVWRSGPAWGLFAGALAFVALAFLVPKGLANLGGSRLDVNREVDTLTHQVDVLKEEKIIGRERADALAEKLEQLRRDASGKDPVKTLESLDHVQDVIGKTAQDAAESATRKTEEMARAETMAEAMERLARKKKDDKKTQDQLTEAMNELAHLTRQAASESELANMELDPETLDALKEGSLSPEQMKKLAEALKKGKAGLKKKIGRLVKAKLIDASALEKCDKAGECSCEGLAAYLKENGGKGDLCDLIAGCEMPGRGGVTRGPGAAKLTFGKETSEDGFKFKEEALPPAALQALKESQITGISIGSPNLGKEKPQTGGSGALSGAKSGGGSASTQIVLPRHRGAVERYFDRTEKAKK